MRGPDHQRLPAIGTAESERVGLGNRKISVTDIAQAGIPVSVIRTRAWVVTVAGTVQA